jgi:hypothetical protein
MLKHAAQRFVVQKSFEFPLSHSGAADASSERVIIA